MPIIFNDSSKNISQFYATASTTDATPTSLGDVATTTNSAYMVWGYVIGEHNTGATAAVGGTVEGVFRNDGTLRSVGVGATIYEDLSGVPTFGLVVSGTNIRLQVTGLTGQTINWVGTLYYMKT